MATTPAAITVAAIMEAITRRYLSYLPLLRHSSSKESTSTAPKSSRCRVGPQVVNEECSDYDNPYQSAAQVTVAD